MSSYHKMYDKFPYIENEVAGIILIPMLNKYREIACYAVASLTNKDKLLAFVFHRTSNRTDVVKYYAESNKGISMHEIVIGGRAEINFTIDHINGNSLDNTEGNLQYASFGLNAQNKPKKLNCSSKYIGVDKVSGKNEKWVARICVNHKSLHLGNFETEIDAAKIYDVYTIDCYKTKEAQTNNLLSSTEIADIIKNGIPPEYCRKIKTLPKYIVKLKSSNYTVLIKTPAKVYYKSTDTLADAIVWKDKYLKEIKETNELNEKLKVIPEITRDVNGLAIVLMGNKMPCVVEDAHWHDINQYSWNCYLNMAGQIVGYPTGMVNSKQILLHRYVYDKYVAPIPLDKTVDHRNSKNIMDVRLSNLRLANKSLQVHNSSKPKNKHDKYTGVEFNQAGYQTRINDIYYGTFEIAELAAEKANEIFKLIYGDDAKLNVIDYSKETTKYNRIPETMITKEFIENIDAVVDLKNIIVIKKLDFKSGGPITMRQVKYPEMDKYKKIIIDKLYSQESVV